MEDVESTATDQSTAEVTSCRSSNAGPIHRSAARRSAWFRAGAIVTGLLVGLLLAEGIVRTLGIQPQRFVTKRQLVDLTADPPLVYHCYPQNRWSELAAAPDVSQGSWMLQEYTFEGQELPLERLNETPWCAEYRYSSKGIRDREYPRRQPGDPQRVGVVGDSFVFGEGVPESLSLPRQLEQALKGQFTCINGGQVGANTEDELPIMEALIREADCRRIIWVLIPNDVPLTPALAQRQKYINDFILVRDRYLEQERSNTWLPRRLRVLDLIITPFELANIQQQTIEWYLACYSQAANGANLNLVQEQMIAAAHRTDARVVLAIYPLLENLESQYPLEHIHATLRSMAERAQLPVFDLLPTFSGQKSSELWVDPADHHPNGTAHQRAAEAIAAWLQQEVPDFLKE